MLTFRSLMTGARPLRRLSAVALAGLALSLALIVGSSPAHAAGTPAAAPSQTTKAPPVISPHTREALMSQLESRLSKLSKHPTLRQLKALGLRPDPKQLAARFNKLANSTRARAADVGSTYWFTYQYYGNIWADVYYTQIFNGVGVPTGIYVVYSNYKLCDAGYGNPLDLIPCRTANECTYVFNVEIDGHYYFYGPSFYTLDSAGMPAYGFLPGRGLLPTSAGPVGPF